jgi:hypothetical protein
MIPPAALHPLSRSEAARRSFLQPETVFKGASAAVSGMARFVYDWSPLGLLTRGYNALLGAVESTGDYTDWDNGNLEKQIDFAQAVCRMTTAKLKKITLIVPEFFGERLVYVGRHAFSEGQVLIRYNVEFYLGEVKVAEFPSYLGNGKSTGESFANGWTAVKMST